jgi:hypothetical protein
MSKQAEQIGRVIIVITALAAWLLVAVVAVPAQSITQDERDDFTGDRIVSSAGSAIDTDSRAEAWAKAVYLQGRWALMLEVEADTWKLLGARTAQVVAYDAPDATPHRFRANLMRIDNEVRGAGRTHERYAVLLTQRQWGHLQGAQRAALRVDGVVYTLSETLQAEMRLVQERVE